MKFYFANPSTHTGELWSLLSFILPGIFNDLDQFSGWFNRPFQNIEEEEESDGEEDGKNDKNFIFCIFLLIFLFIAFFAYFH